MSRRLSNGLLALRRSLVAVLLATLAAAPLRANDPWQVLAETRASLTAAGGLAADFVQTFLPAGFSSGERETGKISLALPDCLRWDYELPFAKSFLICRDEVRAWNPGEGSGRLSYIDAEQEAGLDLLMLGVERLAERYSATASEVGEERTEVHLTALADQAAFSEARLIVDTRLRRPVRISYRDREGNETAFDLSGFRALGSASEAFSAPPDIEWIE